MNMENLTLYNKFRVVPPEAKKAIGGGRLKGMTDINPMWRIKTLTDEFGVCGIGWYYNIISQELKNGANNEIAAIVTIELFIKVDGEWSKPIQGVGGSMFVANERNGAYTSDECFKMALTDAISVSCKALGVGADIYYQKDRTKYDQPITQSKPRQEAKTVNSSLLNVINGCKSQAELRKLWENNPESQRIPQFKIELGKRKQILIDNGIDI